MRYRVINLYLRLAWYVLYSLGMTDKEFWDRVTQVASTDEGRSKLSQLLDLSVTLWGRAADEGKAQFKIPRSAYYCQSVRGGYQFRMTRGVISGNLFRKINEAILQSCPSVTYTVGDMHVWTVEEKDARNLTTAILPFCQ